MEVKLNWAIKDKEGGGKNKKDKSMGLRICLMTTS